MTAFLKMFCGKGISEVKGSTGPKHFSYSKATEDQRTMDIHLGQAIWATLHMTEVVENHHAPSICSKPLTKAPPPLANSPFQNTGSVP